MPQHASFGGSRLPAAALALGLLALVAPGCLLTSHMPYDDSPDHLAIGWRASFDEAAEEASATDRPLLVVLAAGDIVGNC